MDIELERPKTWPKDFLKIAKDCKNLIISYHQEEQRIDRGWEKKRFFIDRPKNKYFLEYKTIIGTLEILLESHRLVTYHCTRLTDDEKVNIINSGIKVLSKEFIKDRIKSARISGYLTNLQEKFLLEGEMLKKTLNNQFGRRTNMIWFVPNQSTLKNSSRVGDLFRLWGGEAVYNCYEHDEKLSGVLRSTGIPVIIKCALPFDSIKHNQENFSEYFLCFLIKDKIRYPDPGYKIDIHIEREVDPSEVIEIVDKKNPLFKKLTQYTIWPENRNI